MKSWFYHYLANEVAKRTDDWLPTWVEKLQFPTVKPPFFVALDDRVLTFKGKWPEISTLREFKPWNKEDAYHKSSGDEWAKTRDALDDHMRMHAPRPLEGKGELLSDTLSEEAKLRLKLESAEAAIWRLTKRVNELRAECAAKDERISELYMAQKSKILSAKSVEYDIGTLQGENAKLKDLVRKLWEEVQADGTMASDHDAEIRAVLVCS